MTYQLTSGDTILRLSDNAFIPPDPGNRDYREYLDWLAEGNTPEPAPAPPPGPDYTAFWEGLMASSLYAAIREQSMTSLPMNTLGTEFIALLGDAKAGRPYEAAIQASMLAILSAGTFTAEQIGELQAVLEAGHLEDIYQLTPPEETVLIRARNEDGTYVADDPSTPENEAYIEVPLSEA